MAAATVAPSSSRRTWILLRAPIAATVRSAGAHDSVPAVAREGGFRLLADEATLAQYLFNTRKNQHYFCRHCGVRAFGIGTETPIGKVYGVNVGCLNDISDEELSRAP